MLKTFFQYKITYTLILLSALVFMVSAYQSQDIIDINIEVLVSMGALYSPYTVPTGDWWRLGSAMFLHADMIHILMNMVSLYLIGREMEKYFDTKSYISIYLVSGVLGGLVSLYIHPMSVGVGASGAIFGIFGALAGFFLANKEKIEAHSKAFMKDFTLILGLNLLLGLGIESIDLSAHIAGLLVGMAGGFMISKNTKLLWVYQVAMILAIIACIQYLPTEYTTRLF